MPTPTPMLFRLRARLRALRNARFWKSLGTPRVLLRMATWAVLVASLEVFARISPSDWFDGVGVIAVGCMAYGVWNRHRVILRRVWRVRLAPLRSRLRDRWYLRAGLDIRGDPPLPERLPWRYIGALLSLMAAVTVLFMARGYFPAGFREDFRAVSGFFYLVYLAGLWGALLGGILFGIFGAMSFIDVLDAWFGWTRRRRRTAPLIASTLLGTIALLTVTAPPLAAIAAIGVALALHTALVAYVAHPVRVIWQYQGEVGRLSWGRGSLWGVLFGGAVSLVLIALILLATGNFGDDFSSMTTIATGLIGRGFAWSTAILFPLFILASTANHVIARRNDPARPVPVCVELTGHVQPADRQLATKGLQEAGFKTCDPTNESSADVDASLRLDPAPEPADPFQPTRWPLAVTPDEALDPMLHDRILRRARQTRRRMFVRRLGSIFKIAKSRKYRRGTGFWVCPHLWYSTHLSRDTDEEMMLGAIGPAYHLAIPKAARHQFYCVMRDLELDLIFLEDGITYRRFKRVLAVLFDYHDKFGARRMEDERSFSGLPGIRVVIHSFDLERPFDNGSYPEPDYEEIGRARILHVFIDRGGEEEEAWNPDGSEFLPAPPRLPDLVLH